MRKLITKVRPDTQPQANGALGTERPTRIFSLNESLYPVRQKTSHSIPNWIRFEEELYFVTINCNERGMNQLCLPHISKGIFSALAFYAQKQIMFPKLVLLMPDHLHGIFAFSAENGIKKTISILKKYLARTYRLNFQDGFFEHRIRNHEHLQQIEDYILNNPIRKELVNSKEDWEYVYRLNSDNYRLEL